eukprot:3137012-Pyramimonas_sp.AAC.1
MTRRMVQFGNPYKYATFLDESLNLNAAVAANNSHRGNWEPRIFEKINLQGALASGQARFFSARSGRDAASVTVSLPVSPTSSRHHPRYPIKPLSLHPHPPPSLRAPVHPRQSA